MSSFLAMYLLYNPVWFSHLRNGFNTQVYPTRVVGRIKSDYSEDSLRLGSAIQYTAIGKLWLPGQICPPPILVNNTLWEHSHSHLLIFVYGHFSLARDELSSQDRDHKACAAKNIYHLVFYRKCLLILTVED